MQHHDAYGAPLARVYDLLAALYSGGAIGTCKQWGVADLPPGSTALFVGAGTAAEVVAAAGRGVRCQIVDQSPAMLQRAQARLRRHSLQHQVPCQLGDATGLPLSTRYDAIIAHFFFNTFATQTVSQVLAQLLARLTPTGRLIVGDYACLRPPARRLQRLYHDLPMLLFARWTGSARHTIHDIAGTAALQGARVVAERHFRIGRVGPAWYSSLHLQAPPS